MRTYLALALALLALMGLMVRFALPIWLAQRQGTPPLVDVQWNFWWAVNAALAVKFFRPGAATRFFGILASWLQLGIGLVKIVLFLLAPIWTFLPAARFGLECASLMLFAAVVFYLHGTAEGKSLAGGD